MKIWIRMLPLVCLALAGVVFATSGAKLGEQKSGDTSGAPGGKKEINNDGRKEGKGPSGPKKEPKGADGGDTKPTPKPAPKPVAKPSTPPATPSAAASASSASSPAEVKKADNATVEKAQKEVDKGNKKAEIINAILDAATADPKEAGAKAMDNAVKGALDAAGKCGSCEVEREAEKKADANAVGRQIVDEAKAPAKSK